MASRESGGESLQSWLNKATDPSNPEDRWDCIQGFYEQVNQEADGPQVATRLLAHKIQSPQRREALQALTVLEACMNNCGKRFHSEAAKFRFLNELIKVLSPKFLGQWSGAEVKLRVTEVLYSWTLWLKEEPKIQEAYRMLKKQGLVKKDPQLPDTIVMPPPSQRAEDSVFNQEDKAKLLARLLKSSSPEDLQTANRLIKNTIKEEQQKAERVSRRVSTLEEVASRTRQLRELLQQHRHTGPSTHLTDQLKAVYERCDRLRPNLFRLASDTVDDDDALAQILQANDELTLVVNMYKEMMGGRRESNRMRGGGGGGRGESSINNGPSSPREIKSYHLIDLSALDSPQTPSKDMASSFLSYETSSPSSSPLSRQRLNSALLSLVDLDVTGLDKPASSQRQSSTYYDELVQMRGGEENTGRDHSLTTGVCGGRDHSLTTGVCGVRDLSLAARGCGSGSSNGTDWAVLQNRPIVMSGSPSNSQSQPMTESGSPVKSESLNLPESLSEIHVPLESIKPSRLEPITVYDQNGVHVSLHFAKDPPPGYPNVAVVVVSTVNTSALPVKGILFQAAVPKTMTVKLQPSSGKELPPYNPTLPPAALSQILLLSNPHRCKVRLRYKLTLVHGDGEQSLSEMGEVEDFPNWVSWMGL
ncbi:ADP-ribosylation factor-binding protein GGA3-like isoform X2 [Coregonus clupeaformis]|uniref:ADP-ribosylation factor-binding protein GGA3-like isoform X2 n=1 Tax=Coregonus clupeaformis TaxID=59861 RepID=UPI001BE1268D|nr:ADP-ribosylation factor-binding protein GGA3-like isoform X2 [Coregonus clupeaformis]